MRRLFAGSLVAVALFSPNLPGQSLQERFHRLSGQLASTSTTFDCDGHGPTNAPAGMRRCRQFLIDFVRAEVETALNSSAGVEEARRFLLGLYAGEINYPPQIALRDDALITLFGIRHGPAAQPFPGIVVDGYRRRNGRWQRVASAESPSPTNYARLEELPPATDGSMIFLLRGGDAFSMQYCETPEMWIFRGDSLRRLWRSPHALYTPQYELTGDLLRVLHEDFYGQLPATRGRGTYFQFDLRLRDGEPAVSESQIVRTPKESTVRFVRK